MLSKCANLACSAKFRYLGEGKVFAVEHRSSANARQSDAGSEFEQIRREFRCFWLCSDCSQLLTLQASGEGGIRLAPSKNALQAKDSSEDLVKGSGASRARNMESQDKLNVLIKELEFLESGGYRLQMGWRPALVFEDSPTCPKLPHSACPNTQCALLDLVPAENRGQVVPCRHIPLDPAGETLQTMYQTATQEEIENTVREWLRKTIEEVKKAAGLGRAKSNENAAEDFRLQWDSGTGSFLASLRLAA
jgi:hypothetical protein